MNSQRACQPLTTAAYLQALDAVKVQFGLVRFALQNISHQKIRTFYTAHFDAKLAEQQSALTALTKIFPQEDLQGVQETVSNAFKAKQRKDNRPSDARFKREFSEDRLNQSELLLLVAHFESFMKIVHRAFLTADPSKVFGKQEIKVMMKDIFDGKPGDPWSRFLATRIEIEVSELDRQGIRQRSKYFHEHYNVSFGDDSEMKALNAVMETRNAISHQLPIADSTSQSLGEDQRIVDEGTLKDARRLLAKIPIMCIAAGAQAYPGAFR